MLVIYSLNANGMRNFSKIKDIFISSEVYNWDILCLQETFWSEDIMSQVEKLWDGYMFYNNYDIKNRRGVAILIKKGKIDNFKNIIYGEKGRLLKVSFEYLDKLVNIFSLYAPNELAERRKFFEKCKTHMNIDEINIIGGDFNDYTDTFLDRSGTMSDQLPNNKHFVTFQKENNLIDVWRSRNPDKRVFSRKQTVNEILKQSRIDAFIISTNSLQYCSNCYYRMSTISDHSYVCIHFDFTEVERGPGMWIFNTTLLNDDYYCKRIYDKISESLQCPLYKSEKLIWWDNLKYKIKAFSKLYAQKKRREEKQEFWTIQNKIQREYSKIDRGIHTDHDRILQLESELAKYEKQKCEGAILRSKAFWAIEGDRNTSYFLRLEKFKQESNCVKELYNSENNIVSDTSSILDAEVNFYRQLYSEEPVNMINQKELLNKINRKLSDDMKMSCEQDMDLKQLTTALQQLSLKKSPGFDGLTVEFYRKFWNVLGPLLVEIVSEIQKAQIMPNSMRRGIITLIYKKKGDKKLLKNWRPITLLNVDYKIISKTLASRLKLVLDKVISKEQTCSVPGRDISDTIASIRDIIEYTKSENVSAYILKIDSEKAFDRVSHEYLFNLLSCFGFGENFIKWIKIFYTDISSAIKCNGHISQFFPVKKSVRQGCSLSPLLYILAAEPLNVVFKESKVLKGIEIKGSGKTSLMYQHADDTTLTLADQKSIAESFKILDFYGSASGARVNVEKSEVLVINEEVSSISNRDRSLVVKSDAIEILGIHLGNDIEKCEHMNWKNKIDKMKLILQLWKQRGLGLKGKSIVIQSLLLSKIWYVLNVQPLPHWAEREIKKICSNFIWNNKPAQIKQTTMIGKMDQGGLNIPDLKLKCQAFRLKWLKKYFDEEVDTIWKNTMDYFLRKYANMSLTYEVFAMIFDKISFKTLPLYYRELLEAWDLLNGGVRAKPSSLMEIYNQPLFSNPNIRRHNKMLLFHIFIKCGVTKISDLINKGVSGFISSNILYEKIITYCPDYSRQKVSTLLNEVLLALPREWIDLITRNYDIPERSVPVIGMENNTSLEATCLTSKTCYDILRSRVYQPPTSLPFIESFGITVNIFFWKTIFHAFKNPIMINLDYKIVHNIVWTKERLYRVKICSNNRCPVCDSEIEDILHMFIDCDYLKSFQLFLKDILSYFYQSRGFTENEFNMMMLFGIPKTEKYYSFINVLLSAARLSIYKRRNYKSLKDKLVTCKCLFDNILKENLSCIFYHLEKQKFEKEFVHNNPYIKIRDCQIIIKW